MKLYIDVFDKSCIVMFYERIFVIQRVLTMQKNTFESLLIYNSQECSTFNPRTVLSVTIFYHTAFLCSFFVDRVSKSFV